MKIVLAVLVVLLLVLVALPVGMGHMGDCPACTAAKGPLDLGICAGVLSYAALTVLLTSTRFRSRIQRPPSLLLARSVYRPPRFS